MSTLLAAATQLACGSGEPSSPESQPSDGFFESANPTGPNGSDDEAGSDGAGGSGGNTATASSGTTGGTPDGEGGDSPERALEEADIVKIVGDRLFAMSRYGGIAVIDVSDTDQLELLGRHKIDATPFEMYVKDGIVFALYQDYGEYVVDEDDGTAAWTQTSQVVVIDAHSPGSMTELSRFAIPGSISDSRIVGNILYVAAFENGYCWGCEQERPKTTVVSLDVSEPADVEQVDELAFEDSEDGYSWRRSLSVNDQRIYVAGPVWGSDRPVGSTIQVIDISDPAGDLIEGATVEVSGQINSRWQMDEHEGVLRVISQPFDWDLSVAPKVETFTVSASDDVTSLGSLSLTLPRPEQLQSVRFDGDRGYAITFERTDPLLTIDLSNPVEPVQAGMLEMPGWLYHMEPRGDRLLGLGFDQGNSEGALTVSVFDVSNLESPVMLDRANFGGDWGWMVEDQDRIHKAFRLFDDADLIVMPFSGWIDGTESSEGECSSGRWVSGIQLIDWQDDSVTARGVAETRAEARRGLLHEGRLLTVSDERVEAFDIDDRDAPKATSNVALAQYVQRTAVVGDQVARIGQNWYSSVTEIDVAPLDEVTTPRSTEGIDIGYGDTESCSSYSYLIDVFSSDERLWLVHREYEYTEEEYTERLRVAGIDVSDPSRPVDLGSSVLDIAPGYDSYDYSLPGAGRTMVKIGDALVVNHSSAQWLDDGSRLVDGGMYVVDVSDVTDAKSHYLELPGGLGTTGFIVDGSIVARSHYEASPNDPSKVRFFLDRVDVSDPEHPAPLPSLNTPGAVVAISGKRAFAIDYRSRVVENTTYQDCYYDHAKVVDFEVPEGEDYWTARGTCSAIVEIVTLFENDETGVTVLGQQSLKKDEMVSDVALGSDVMFATLSRGYFYYYDDESVGDCWGCFNVARGAARVLTLGGLKSGQLEVGRLELDGGDYWYSGMVRAAGDRAIVSTGWRGELTVLDARDPAKPEVVREVALDGYLSDITMLGSTAVVSMGYDGIQTVDLAD